MKLISTKTHGMLDYLTAGMLLAAPRLLGWNNDVTRLLTGAALGTVGYSLLTRYELGAFKILPMPAHLGLDAVQGVLLGVAPLFLNIQPPVAASLAGMGLFELAVTLNSETEPRPNGILMSDNGKGQKG
ncbi:MAG: hypothetical protein KJ077_42915 [Anaerolineae bacterium]|nr:hypothetical protein [Anaerolineae bacterium]